MDQPKKRQKLYACRVFSNNEDLSLESEDRQFPAYLFEYWNLSKHDEMKGREVKVEIEVASWGLERSYSFISEYFKSFDSMWNHTDSIFIQLPQIKTLYEHAQTILQSPTNADKLLPLVSYPKEGYDKHYFINLRTTVIMLKDILKEKLWTEKGWFFLFKIS